MEKTISCDQGNESSQRSSSFLYQGKFINLLVIPIYAMLTHFGGNCYI